MLKPLPEEDRLRAELERARGALAHLQKVGRLGTWERDAVTGAVKWSDGLVKLLDLAEEVEPSLQAWLDLVHPDDQARVIATIVAGLEGAPATDTSAGSGREERNGSFTWTRASRATPRAGHCGSTGSF